MEISKKIVLSSDLTDTENLPTPIIISTEVVRVEHLSFSPKSNIYTIDILHILHSMQKYHLPKKNLLFSCSSSSFSSFLSVSLFCKRNLILEINFFLSLRINVFELAFEAEFMYDYFEVLAKMSASSTRL